MIGAKFKVLDRPSTGDDLEARQKRWDGAQAELRILERAAWLGARRARLTRERKGSKRSRRLFEERVVAPAIARWTSRMAVVETELSACGEIVEITIGDFVENAKYDTVTIGDIDPDIGFDPRTLR